MALRVPETNFWDHFSIQTSPQNPQKHTLGTKIGPRKVIFGHFAFFWYFYLIFPWARGKIFKSISTNQKFTPDKKEIFSWLLKHLNQRKNTSPLTHFHFYHFRPYLFTTVITINVSIQMSPSLLSSQGFQTFNSEKPTLLNLFVKFFVFCQILIHFCQSAKASQADLPFIGKLWPEKRARKAEKEKRAQKAEKEKRARKTEGKEPKNLKSCIVYFGNYELYVL